MSPEAGMLVGLTPLAQTIPVVMHYLIWPAALRIARSIGGYPMDLPT
jgi:hypothetical protein